MKQFICFEHDLIDSDRLSASFTLNGKDIWIFKSKDGLKAFGNCPHRNAPLKNARLSGTYIICTEHGNRFDFITGKNEGPFIRCGNLPTYDLEVVNGEVYVFIEDPAMVME